MNRQLLWSLLLIGGAVLIAGVLVLLRPQPTQEPQAEQVPLVQTVPLEAASGPIPVMGSGTVEPREEVTIAVQVQGRLTYVNPDFREGAVVSRGATLLRIEESDFRNDVRIAQADVAAQDVAVLEAEEEVAIAREELERFAAREAAGVQGGAGETRILPPRELAEIAVPDPSQADDAGETAARRGLATREPQLRSARAARERARAGLADARLLLGRTRLTAPFSGLVRQEDAAVGALVQVGQSLGSIVATDAYEVRIALSAEEAALIPGLLSPSRGRIPARIRYDFGGKIYQWNAFVDRADAILDSATRNIDVFLRVPAPLSGGRPVDADAETRGPAPPLLLGAFVKAEITGASLESYAVVPAIAVRPGNEIWVVREGKLQILPARIIQRTDELAYISTPTLAEGGGLVVSNLTAPITGMKVRRDPVQPAAAMREARPRQGRGE
ncbi:MAG: HlyD family efflux transporter periplasmic adaptor subunit [Erythrobacter sp.]|jgi:multidrug efflux pump subunit AcrA (membrane-fusion protein)|nr:HlyD family efflux transporter periplasmic adaptor subunit [Erythrobacter sp.]